MELTEKEYEEMRKKVHRGRKIVSVFGEEIKQEINNKEKELSLLKEEFEKRKRLIEDNSTFDIDKILF